MSKKIDDLLLEKLSKYGMGIGDITIKKAATKLKKEFHVVKIKIDKGSIVTIRDDLEKVGKILEENKKDNYYLLSVGGGAFNLNPVICIVKIDKDITNVIGYAKEGLIKQNSARKAIARIVSAIS